MALQAGTLAQYLTLLAVIVGAFFVWRGGGSTALGVLETANRVLEERVHELERLRAKDVATISELQGRTDVALALVPLVTAIDTHEERAAARFERMLAVQDLIASRLGPDANGEAE